MINKIFRKLLHKSIIGFIDDILLYSYRSRSQHIELILQVLEKCKKHGLAIKLSKYIFYKQKLRFLRYIVSGKQIEIDKNSIETIIQ